MLRCALIARVWSPRERWDGASSERRSVRGSFMSGPLGRAALAMLFPPDVRGALRRSNAGGGEGDLGWAAGAWVAAFVPVVAVVIAVNLLLPGLAPNAVFHFVTTWLLGLPLAGAGWCLLRHVAGGERARPNLVDDIVIVVVALVMALIL